MDLCTLRFHYEGYFASEGDTLMYEGGLVDDLRVDPDRLSWYELNGVLRRGGYRNIKAIFYRRQYFSLADGIRIVDSDASVNSMVAEMMLEGEIDVYVEHGVEELEVALHLIEAPPANDGENGQQCENSEEAENAHNNDGNGGDVGNEGNEDSVGDPALSTDTARKNPKTKPVNPTQESQTASSRGKAKM
ncbi:hypothetical protein COLO4_05936 [Corchorus olitorius]|uniref:PB1-like domain-containing protein n=1 Tax=Corchorus olitorius TaxID=93759 RepID=A0A1R3KPF2_9ROSI|nr:hypothetical protein COLO4_05936 [Corchorus olitorius]